MSTTERTKSLSSINLIDGFTIRTFRGIDVLPLHQVGLINLLVGSNNSGKTSVLESLAVFSSPLDLAAWSNVARNREVRHVPSFFGVGLNAVDAIRWLFPQRAEHRSDGAEEKFTFTLACEGKTKIQRLTAECSAIRGIPPERPSVLRRQRNENAGTVEDQGWLVAARIDSDSSTSEENAVQVELWPSVGFYRMNRNLGPHIPAVTLAPYSHRNQPLQLRKFSELIESDEKLAVLDLLKALDSDVTDLEIITDRYTGSPTLLVKHRKSGSVPVSVLGDGFRRALAIALSIPQARRGLLLIDEIETALYSSFLTKLFGWLVRACHDYEVQLFATTHSLEAVTAMVNAVPSTGITAYHLSSVGEPVKRYSPEMLARLVRDRGLDIR